MDLNQCLSFTTVIERGSFSAAGRELALPRSTVSARVAALERRLGTRLLRRTTRSIALTDDGKAYYALVAPAVAAIRAAEQRTGQQTGSFSGSIRLSVPLDFPVVALGNAIASFQRSHPQVKIHVFVSNDVVDFVRDNIDLALRGGEPGGGDFVAKRIASFRFGAFRRPAHPMQPAGLLGFTAGVHQPWRRGRIRARGDAAPTIVSNSFAMLKQLALSGAGVAVLPVHMCASELDAGQLMEVQLPEVPADAGLYLVHLSRKDMTPRVRAFARHLRAAFERPMA
jgi:DNA-binding transcriptional LysR family regulator